MKYGIIDYNYGDRAAVYPGYNIGDVIQRIALEKLYQNMQIPDEEILHLSLCDIKNYCGEYVLLPVCGLAVGIGFSPIPLSSKIVPVFISTHIAKTELSIEEVAYLKEYEPIGCRDEMTLETMRRYHIQAYLSGCITTIFARREKEPEEETILLIDVPESLESYLPEKIRCCAKRISHLLPIPSKTMTPQEVDMFYHKSVERLNYYCTKATLVISSRLHALVPCIAMGIPVIGVFENISHRFAWLDKFINLYSPEHFGEIDWDPVPVEYEHTKQILVQLFSEQIKAAHKKYALMYTVSNFYENRKRSEYGNHYIESIRKMHMYMPEEFSYLIWGCGLIGETVWNVMRQEFPKAKLFAAIDNFVEGRWHGVPIIKPTELEKYSKSFIILATYSGKEECKTRMTSLGRVENRDFIYVATQNG